MDEKRIKIYLDHCCYNRPFDEQYQDLVRLETEAKREHFDYTEWQRTLWEDLTIDGNRSRYFQNSSSLTTRLLYVVV